MQSRRRTAFWANLATACSAGLVTLLLASCSSTSAVSMSDPDVDLSQFHTFNFLQHPDTDNGNYESLETGYLKEAVSRAMTDRRFKLSDDPDLLVNFSIATQEKVRSRTVPSARGGIGYDPFYDVYYDDWAMGHETRIVQYTEGYLNIDLIDPSARKLVWQGATKGRLTKKDYENARKTLNEAVSEIFTQFPVAPGGMGE